MNDTKRIMYVGDKAIKTDTVARTRIVWAGKGDIQAVPAEAASKMLRHPDVWVEVDAKGKPMAGVTPEVLPKVKDKDPEPDREKESGEQEKAETVADESQETGEPASPGNDSEDPVAEAIRSLEPGNPDHFSDKGKPKLAAVRAIAGEDVTVKQLNEAWKALSE